MLKEDPFAVLAPVLDPDAFGVDDDAGEGGLDRRTDARFIVDAAVRSRFIEAGGGKRASENLLYLKIKSF